MQGSSPTLLENVKNQVFNMSSTHHVHVAYKFNDFIIVLEISINLVGDNRGRLESECLTT